MSCCKELHCQQVSPWALSHVFLIFKGVDDLPQACIKTGRAKMLPDGGVGGAAFRVWKGFIWSIYCHGNSECDLQAFLAQKPDGKVWEKKRAEPQLGSERGGKAAALARPQGCKEPRCLLCAKGDSEGPASVDEERAASVLLQVAGLDEHARNLLQLFLPSEGRQAYPCSFIHSFIL